MPSQKSKGDAIILLSVIITGILVLVAIVSVDNLRKSSQIQGSQKKSLDSLFEAEEGIEFSLYVNKEKERENWLSSRRPYKITTWENNNENRDDEAYEKLIEDTAGKDIVVVSEGDSNANDNLGFRRSLFTKLPSRYRNQVCLYYRPSGNQLPGDTLTNDNLYQVLIETPDYQKIGWSDKSQIEYRLIFRCSSASCQIKDVKVGIKKDNATSNCSTLENGDNYSDFTENITIKSALTKGQPSLVSEWFTPEGQNTGETLDLKGRKLAVEFALEQGTMDTRDITNTLTQPTPLTMCRSGDGGDNWTEMPAGITGGLVEFQVRKKGR